LNYSHLASVRASHLRFGDSQVASFAVYVFFGKSVYENFGRARSYLSANLSPVGYAWGFAFGDQFFHERSYLFGFGFGGFNFLMQDERAGKRIDQSFPYFAHSAEFSVLIMMTHTL